MLTIIKNLSELSENENNDISSFLANPKSKQCTLARFLLLESDGETLVYKNLSLPEEISEEKVTLYLYPTKKDRPPRGTFKTPVVVYNDFEKSYIQKIFDWSKNNKNKTILFEKIHTALFLNENQIKEELFNLNKNTLLSIKIDNKYIGEFPEFTSLFLDDEELIKDISSSKQDNLKNIKISNSTCAVCLKDNCSELYGFASPFTFYSVKGGRFSYNFDSGNSAKQLPVCLECAKKIRGSGLKFLQNKLNFRLFNTNYFLIPELINDDNEKLKEIINKISKRYKAIQEKKDALPDKKDQNAIRRLERILEKEFLESLPTLEKTNFLTYNFFFYQQDQQKFNILANIEEVSPTNLKKMFDSIKKINDAFEENEISLNPTTKENPLFVLKNFIIDRDNKGFDKSKKEFFEVLDKIFNLKPLNYSYFLKKLMKRIHEEIPEYIQGKSTSYFKKNVMDSFFLINIFADLGLFKNDKELIQGDIMTEIQTPLLDKFCGLFPNYFNQQDKKYNIKKAILAYGIFFEHIAQIQTKYYNDKDSKPIYKKFRNFKVDIKFLKNKLYELENCSQKYRKALTNKYPYLFYRADKINRELSKCFVLNDMDLSTTEANYLFILGKSLYWEFIEQSFPKKDGKDSQ